MYTTQNNREREGESDSQIEKEIVRQRGGGGYRQIDVCNIEHQIERQLDEEEEDTDRCIQHSIIDRERQLDREEEKVATDRQMYTTQNNRQIERQLDREEEKVATDRQMYTTKNNRQIERQLDREEEEEVATDDVYILEQQIDREIVRQRGGGEGGRYRQMYTT